MTKAILDRVAEWVSRNYPIETQAMWLASDYFRKMGKMERDEVIPALDALYPEMMSILRENYPDRI